MFELMQYDRCMLEWVSLGRFETYNEAKDDAQGLTGNLCIACLDVKKAVRRIVSRLTKTALLIVMSIMVLSFVLAVKPSDFLAVVAALLAIACFAFAIKSAIDLTLFIINRSYFDRVWYRFCPE